MSDKPELKPCPFRHIEKDYEHELSVIKDPEKHGLARVCCLCGYRSPVMGFDDESVINAHNSIADLAKPSEWIERKAKAFDWFVAEMMDEELKILMGKCGYKTPLEAIEKAMISPPRETT